MVIMVRTPRCDECGKKDPKIKVKITKRKKICKKCHHIEYDVVTKEFCSSKCVAKFMRKYDKHKCKDHYIQQISDKDLKPFFEHYPLQNIMVTCKLCNSWATMEVKCGKRGLIKKILRKTGKY